MSNASCVYKVDPDVVSEKLGEEVVLVHLETGRIHHTNEMGTRIWELLQAGRSIAEIVETLQEQYTGAADAMDREVREFVESLSRETIIEPAELT